MFFAPLLVICLNGKKNPAFAALKIGKLNNRDIGFMENKPDMVPFVNDQFPLSKRGI